MEYYLLYLNKDDQVRYKFLKNGDEMHYFYISYEKRDEKSRVALYDIDDVIFDIPSTNGIYLVDGFVLVNERIPKNKKFLLVTSNVLDDIKNDKKINTMSADPRYFYRGKFVDIKAFVKKLLERIREQEAIESNKDKNSNNALRSKEPTVWDKLISK